MNLKRMKTDSKEGNKFLDLMYSKGYRSLLQFSKTCGIDSPNIRSNINGTFKVSIARCFIFADALGVPVMDIINIFYHEEVKLNKAAIKKFDPDKIK